MVNERNAAASQQTSIAGSDGGNSSYYEPHRRVDQDHDEITLSQREMRTKKSVLEAEERRWECEYRLAENENGRLRDEIN